MIDPTAQIHETALIGSDVIVGPNCHVGPYCVLEGSVRLGRGNRLVSHVRLEGDLSIGEQNTFFPFTCIGAVPQDLKYKGEKTFVRIGSHNVFRESVTVNRGTINGAPGHDGTTVVGDHNLIMAYTHIAHDCRLGSHIIIANSTQLAGHITIEDHAKLGGANLVVQNVRIGTYAFTGAGVVIRKDVAPFVIGSGSLFEPVGINEVGLQREGFLAPAIQSLKQAYKIYFLSRLGHREAIDQLKQLEPSDEVKHFIRFVESTLLGLHR